LSQIDLFFLRGLVFGAAAADKNAVAESRKTLRDAWSAFAGPQGWRAIAWPATFAVAALVLLVYDHLQARITHLVFWLCVVLIGCVFAWLVEKTRRQSRDLAVEHERATRDSQTGLPNRVALLDDLSHFLSRADSPQTFVMFELDGLQAHYDRCGDASGDALVTEFVNQLLGAIVPVAGHLYRVDQNRFAGVVPAGSEVSGELLLGASHPLSIEDGTDPVVGRSCGEVALPGEAADPESALQLASRRVAAYKQRQHFSARRQAHGVLMAVMAARRPELRAHLRTVAFRSISLSRRLGLDRDAIDDVFLAAELEDIGLLTVPEAILEKKSTLSESEAALIRNHPVSGAEIVAAAPGLCSVATIIHAISERFDGTGYPDGVAVEEIPVGARIIAVCVAFAAMTSNRPYRPARSESEALLELQSCAGSQFDPAVVAALAADLADEAASVGADSDASTQAADHDQVASPS
jgi:HD-GYP domain-containing protein (c-di-GMP phosphodiesterase class II)